MTVKITRQSDNFLLIGANKGLLLTVSCAERLTRYNQNKKNLRVDFQLYKGFEAAHDSNPLHLMIDELVRTYGLQRRLVLRGEQFGPILAQYLSEIRSLPDTNIDTIDIISRKFYTLGAIFSQALERSGSFPEISLSKLLHFVHPGSFWLIDGRVQTILDIWGYRTDFAGFGSLLKDLFRNPEFERFRTFLMQRDREFVGTYPINSLSCPFLKLLDKLLWSK